MNANHALHLPGAVLAAVCVAALLAASAPAAALDRGAFTLEVLVDGAPLAEYAGRGTTYVEALVGREYAIRLRNNTAQRVAVALSVDGLNTIDAKSGSAREGAKWILGPYQTITLDGWQTSSSTARRFFFTTEPQSYGAWLGDTRNLGIISAAVFRERRRGPIGIHHKMAPPAEPAPNSDSMRLDASGEGADAQAGPGLSDKYAATGIGQEVGHEVVRVRFDAEPFPAAVLDIRYEFRDSLIRLGVLPRHHAGCEDRLSRRERARGFEPMEFAPDPWRER